MATLDDPQRIILRKPFPTTTPADDNPTVDNLTACGVTRGVEFTWDLDVSTARRLYYSYRWATGEAPTGEWQYTKGNYVRAELAYEQLVAGLVQAIYIQVRVHDYNGYTSETESTNSETKVLSVQTVDSTDDILDGTVDADALTAALRGRIFDTEDKLLSETTESADCYLAAEHGADITADHTANDVAKIDGTAVATVVTDIAKGATAQDKLIADGVETDSGNEIAYVVSGEQNVATRIDSRLTSTEKGYLDAEKTIDGNHDLYHDGNKPTASDVGLGDVENLSPAEMVEQGLDVDVIERTGIVAANVGAVDVDGLNAPENILNAELTIATDDDTDFITLKRNINDVATKICSISKADLSLDNLENKSASDILDDLTAAKITAATDFTLDDVPDGDTTYALVTKTKDAMIGPARIIWSEPALGDNADAVETERTVTGAGASVKRELIKIPYVYSKGDDTIDFYCQGKSTTTLKGHLQIKVWNFNEGNSSVGTEVDIADVAYAKQQASFDCSTLPLNDDGGSASDGDAYMIWILVTQDNNAEETVIKRGLISVTT